MCFNFNPFSTSVLTSNTIIQTKASTPIEEELLKKEKPLSKELSKAIISQLSILVTNFNNSNWRKIISQIHYLLDKHPQVFPKFLRRLITIIATEIVEDKKDLDSTTTKVLQHELNYLTLISLDKVSVIPIALCIPDTDLFQLFSLKSFLSFFILTDFQKLLIGLSIEEFLTVNQKKEKEESLYKQLPSIYIRSLPGVIQWIQLLEATTTEDQYNLAIFLHLFLKSEIFSLPHKFIVIGHVTESFSKSEDNFETKFDKVNIEINNYFDSINNMSFRDTLLELCDTKLLPDKLLNGLLLIQQSDKLNDAITLLLSEILYPGSQKLSNDPTNMLTSLTPTNIPEATARGSQMLNIFNKLKSQPNWGLIFEHVLNNHSNTPSSIITTASLSQFLSSIQKDDLIDLFLTTAYKTSNSNLLKELLIHLNNFDTNQGSINLYSLSLTPILQSEANVRQLLLYYKSIVMLEVKTIALLQSENLNDNVVTQIFNRDYNAAPEYIVLACLHILHDNSNAKENDVIINIMQNFIVSLLDINSPYLGSIFSLFEKFNPVELGKLLMKYYEVRKSPESIHKIASLTASFKDDTVIMSILSNSSDFPEAFSVAVIFSQYGWKRFQNFVITQLDRNINVVSGTIIEFMEKQASIEYENAQQGRRPIRSLNLETVYFLMTTLGSKQLAKELFERFRNLQALCLQAYPRLINFGQGHDSAILMNSSTNTFSVDVEKEMKVYYQKMYKKEIEIKDVIHMLQRLKDSDNPHDQDVFACMIHSLLDEYRFFPEYPVDALATTSVLFGNTIFFRLVEGPALSIALRYILDSARQPPQSKMFKFAIQALYSFMKRLSEFPKFCAMLCEITALQSQPQLYETCKAIASGNSPQLNSPQNAEIVPNSQTESNVLDSEPAITSKFISISVPEKIFGSIIQEVPNNEVSDRILFMINNITESNMDARVKEMKEILKPANYKWFSRYLVIQRVKLELNNQPLYADVVENIGAPLFYSHVLNITMHQIVLLLNKAFGNGDEYDSSELLNSTERTHLKNLGAWLGRISVFRDYPIQRRSLSFKGILVEAYDHKKLDIVIPFVCRVLDQTRNSKVFKYPNPWLLGILQVLKELYEVAELKLNLKFEFEVLCNSLSVDLNKVKSSNIIRNHKVGELESFVESQKVIINMAKMSLDEKRGILPVIPGNVLDVNISGGTGGNALQQQQQQQQSVQQQLNALQQLQQHRLLGNGASPALNNVSLGQQAAMVAANAAQQQAQQNNTAFENLIGNTIFVTHPSLKRIFQLAITKTVKEVLPPVVNRTNSVALVSTKALVLKDFAFEVDELKFRKAYINTVRHLSESLTLASCYDLLRESIQINFQQYLQTLGQQLDANTMEELPRAIRDNLPLACAIIQKAAMEKSVQDLDEAMLPAIALRRQFRESRPDQVFCDAQNASRYAISLPEPLGIVPGGVSAKQFSIYEEFGKQRSIVPGINQFDGGISSTGAATIPGIVPPSSLSGTPITSNPNLNTPEALAQRVLQQQLLQQQQQHQQQQTTPLNNQDQATNIQQAQAAELQRAFEQALVFIPQAIESLQKDINEIEEKEDASKVEAVKVLVSEIILVLSKVNHNEVYMKTAQLAMNVLFSSPDPPQFLIDTFVLLLDAICNMSSLVAKFVTAWLINAEDERKYNKKIMASLIMTGMISLNELDSMLAKSIQGNKDEKVINFACDLILDLVFSEKPIALRADFVNVIMLLESGDEIIKSNEKVKLVLSKLSSTDNLNIEQLKTLSLEPKSMNDYFAYIFSEWVKLYKFGNNNLKLQVAFINQLVETGIFNKPELLISFFTTSIEMSVVSFIKESDNSKRTPIDTYTAIDATAKLIINLLLVQEDSSDDNISRVEFFKKILSVVLLAFSHDHEINKGNFNERPYFRFFSTLLCEWAAVHQCKFKDYIENEEELKSLNRFHIQFHLILAGFFLSLQPAAFPGFTFAWMCLISHRMFLPMIMEMNEFTNECWCKYTSLLVALLRFQSGYVKDKNIPEAITVIYKGTLRIFLVLLHDYPEYLVQWAYPLVSVTSLTFIQLRNIILSATPKDMETPDPFQPGLKVDRLPEISNSPIVSSDPSQTLVENSIKKAVDNYLRIPSNSLLRQIMPSLELNEYVNEAGIGYNTTKYNIKLINALVLYAGISVVEERPKNSLAFNQKSSQVSLLSSIMQEGSVELQFQMLQAIANNLRYPNSHTHWFSCVILHFFCSNNLWSDNKLNIQQLITRVLLERIICNKPHPWGLLVTFTELLKNSEYEFFDLPFTKSSPEVERLSNSLLKHAKGSSTVIAN